MTLRNFGERGRDDDSKLHLRDMLLRKMRALFNIGMGPQGICEILRRTQEAKISFAVGLDQWTPNFVAVTLARRYGMRGFRRNWQLLYGGVESPYRFRPSERAIEIAVYDQPPAHPWM